MTLRGPEGPLFHVISGRSNSRTLSSQDLQEFAGCVESREYSCQTVISHVADDGFSDDLAEVGGESQVATFVKLRLTEAGPAAINLAALQSASQDEHYVGVAVVGTAV